MTNISIILDRAADHIERYGLWTRGGSRPASLGSTCTALAMGEAAGGRVASAPAREFFASFIGVDDALTGIFAWNDDPRRTQFEVVSNLRAAAMLARQGLAKTKTAIAPIPPIETRIRKLNPLAWGFKDQADMDDAFGKGEM